MGPMPCLPPYTPRVGTEDERDPQWPQQGAWVPLNDCFNPQRGISLLENSVVREHAQSGESSYPHGKDWHHAHFTDKKNKDGLWSLKPGAWVPVLTLTSLSWLAFRSWSLSIPLYVIGVIIASTLSGCHGN